MPVPSVLEIVAACHLATVAALVFEKREAALVDDFMEEARGVGLLAQGV